MGHKHQWCSYPPEGEVRRRKTWDELEGDEEEMVTNARVLEDIEDLRLMVKKDPGFRESSSWPTLTEWCSSCVEMRYVKFVMPEEHKVETVKECDEREVLVNEVKEREEKAGEEEPVEEAEMRPDAVMLNAGKCPDAGTKVESSEPGAHRRKRRGGKGSRLRRLLIHQLLLTERRGLPLSRLLRTEAKSQKQGRREQEVSASPLLRRRRPESSGEEGRGKNGEREGAKDLRGEVEERREEVRCCSRGAPTGDTIILTPRGTQTEVTTTSSQVFPQIPGTPPFPHLTPPPNPSPLPVSPPYTHPYTLPPTHPYTLPFTPPYTPPYTPLFTPIYTSLPAHHTPPYTPPPCGPMPGLQWLFCGGCQAWGTVTPNT